MLFREIWRHKGIQSDKNVINSPNFIYFRQNQLSVIMTPSLLQKYFFLSCLILSLVILACEPNTPEQTNEPFDYSTPESKGLIADSLSRIDDLFDLAVADEWLAGAVALVAVDGDIVYEKAFGYRNISQKDSMEISDIFRIASMSKPITSLAILQLQETGALSFDDPVSKFIPEFANAQVLDSVNPIDSTYTSTPSSREITIHHLLTHTSGISYGFADTTMNKLYAKAGIIDLTTLRPVTLEENIAKLAQLPLKHEPGERWSYGLSIDVLGRVVEVASGMPFDQYLKQYIFEPLGMDDTGFYFDDSMADRLTTMYANQRDPKLKEFPNDPERDLTGDFPIRGAKSYFSGGGGLSSTAHDYLKFAQAILNGGELNGTRIIKEETLQNAKENKIGELQVGKNKFTYGYMIIPQNGDLRFNRSPNTISWSGAFQTSFWIDQERKTVGIMLSQMYPSYHQSKIYTGFEKAVNQSFDAAFGKK